MTQLESLHSLEDVLATFPAGRRPSLRRLMRAAREAGCCVRLGRGGSLKALKTAGGWETLRIVDETYGHLELTEVHEFMRNLSKTAVLWRKRHKQSLAAAQPRPNFGRWPVS